MEMEWSSITHIAIRGIWKPVVSVELVEMQLGEYSKKTPELFLSDCNLGNWIKLVDAENDTYYYPVTQITGIY